LCNARYQIKGKRGCESRHIDERVLYQAFISTFNAVVENKDCFMEKWQRILEDRDDALKVITAKRFIQIFSNAEPVERFDVDLYFKLVEKIVVHDAGRLVVSLIDGSEIECEIE